ncbi:hypothetical protein B0H13DRAFT_1863884 [Mycena leptocephala]|nr:hypothetical protein B0H13DRAFT_1863884 [Mycena leptocephala]
MSAWDFGSGTSSINRYKEITDGTIAAISGNIGINTAMAPNAENSACTHSSVCQGRGREEFGLCGRFALERAERVDGTRLTRRAVVALVWREYILFRKWVEEGVTPKKNSKMNGNSLQNGTSPLGHSCILLVMPLSVGRNYCGHCCVLEGIEVSSQKIGPKIFEPVTGHRGDLRRCKTSHNIGEKGLKKAIFCARGADSLSQQKVNEYKVNVPVESAGLPFLALTNSASLGLL